jgi:hypothetical protein
VLGEPGGIVAFDVTLTDVDQDVEIAATQNDIAFDPLTPIAANSQGGPLCIVNPEIDKGDTSFSFQPPGCTVGTSCSAVRVLVLAFDNLDPIPSGSVLYTCQVVISPDVEIGEAYPLSCSLAAASSPEGEPIAIRCEDGEVEIAPASGF